MGFLTNPISAAFLILAVIAVIWPLIEALFTRLVRKPAQS